MDLENKPELKTLFQQAKELQLKEQLAEAIETYQQILNIMPSHADSLQSLGLAYAQLGDMESAE